MVSVTLRDVLDSAAASDATAAQMCAKSAAEPSVQTLSLEPNLALIGVDYLTVNFTFMLVASSAYLSVYSNVSVDLYLTTNIHS